MRMWGMFFREYMELSLGVSIPPCTLDDVPTDHVRFAEDIVERLGRKNPLALFKGYLRHGYYPFYFEERN